MPYLFPQSYPPTTSNTRTTRSARKGNGKSLNHPSALPIPKSKATCTLSLVSASNTQSPEPTSVDLPPQVLVRSGSPPTPKRAIAISVGKYRPNKINVIPFPTSSSTRPLPIPPSGMAHALLRPTTSSVTSTSPPRQRIIANGSGSPPKSRIPVGGKRTRKGSASVPPSTSPPARISPPPMQRRTSRDPNVADHLVVELDDVEEPSVVPGDIPARPSSPTPEAHLQERTKSPDQTQPPAYSTLPPPYSLSDYEEKKESVVDVTPAVEETKAAEVTVKPKAIRPPASSSSSASSSTPPPAKRARVSNSELKVLVYLYRTIVYGLEVRHRKESSTSSAPTSGRSTPVFKARAVPLPEEKRRFERVLADKAKAREARFPFVEDDDENIVDDTEDEEDVGRTPYPSPSQSPRSSPGPLSFASPFITPRATQKSKAHVNAELDVQDALLAIRLRAFLKAQGVQEGDLEVDMSGADHFSDEEPVVRDERKAATSKEDESTEEEDILESYFSGTDDVEEDAEVDKKEKRDGPFVEEDEEDIVVQHRAQSRTAKHTQGPLVEDEEDMGINVDMDVDSSSNPPTSPAPLVSKLSTPLLLQTSAPTQRLSTPPPTTPSPRPRAVLPPSYMVALLTMRNRYNSSTSPRRDRKDGKERKSGLSVCVEID